MYLTALEEAEIIPGKHPDTGIMLIYILDIDTRDTIE
jgi:hypothetical protein